MSETVPDQHVIPLDDLMEHSGPDCLCNPTIHIEGSVLVYIHHSYDGREEWEWRQSEQEAFLN